MPIRGRVPDREPFLAQPLSNELFFITGFRLFMVAMVFIATALLLLLLRYTRLGIRIRAGQRTLPASPPAGEAGQ